MTRSAVRLIELYPFRFHLNHLEYLLLRRSPDDRLYPGIWQIVTGTIEHGEKAYEAAIRELKEETGFAPLRFWVLPDVSSFYDPESDSVQTCVVFCCQVSDGTDPVLSEEHRAWQWCGSRKAKPLLAWPSQRDHIDLVDATIGRGDISEKLLDISRLVR